MYRRIIQSSKVYRLLLSLSVIALEYKCKKVHCIVANELDVKLEILYLVYIITVKAVKHICIFAYYRAGEIDIEWVKMKGKNAL